MAIYSDLAKLGRVKLPSGSEYALIDVDGRSIIAPNFSTEAIYEVGDHVIYGDNLYRFKAHHDAGEWSASEVDNVTVDSEIKRIESAISGGIHYRGKTSTALYDGATTNPISIGGSSYTALAGDLVIYDRSSAATLTYATGTAYSVHTYIKNEGIVYITNAAISASENTSLNAIASKLDVVKSDPEFLFDGSIWNLMGSVADGLGDLAFKDSASGSYVRPTGSGSVTVKEYSNAKAKLSTTTIKGVAGTESVSKMSAGTAVEVAKVGTAVRYGTANVGSAVTYGTANKATSATTVGNANVGQAVVYGTADVGSAVTVATAGTQVVYGTADVGAEVTYGTANPGTAVTGVAKVGSQKSFNTNASRIKEVDGDCLIFEFASTDNVIGIADTTGVSITPAVASTSKLTPAKAADTTRKLTPVGGTTSITPAISADSTRTLTPAVASTTSIYGAVDSTSTLTPAVAAPSSQTIIPAVANGSITPWSETAKTVATAAASATTVATGSLEEGTQLVTGISSSDATKTVTVSTTTDTVTVK